jgi:hypothetical protein
VVNEESGRQTEFIYSLLQFTKPDSMSQGQSLYLSEDDILRKYTDTVHTRYLHYLKHTKCLLKHIVTRVTIEGEHTYLMLVRAGPGGKPASAGVELELIPMMNAPH